jgi:hypothetical protein
MTTKKESKPKAKTRRPLSAVIGGEEKPLMKFRHLAGLHIQEDFSADPVVTKDQNGNDVHTYPTRTYKAGETVYHHGDLVDKFGQEKFVLLGESEAVRAARGAGSHTHGDPTPELLRTAPTEAPHGQVSTGYPQAVTHDPDDEEDVNPEVGQGKMDSESAHEMEAQAAEELEEDEEQNEEAAARSADTKGSDKPPGRKPAPAHGRAGGRTGKK